ncbi:MAG: malonate decarboxylase subunit epsilon [Vulcanimicrobiaceae bacterium]
MIALLFPGQGAQRRGMLADVRAGLAAESFDVATLVDRASELVGRDLRAIDAEPGAYRSTADAQYALVLAGIACARAFEARGLAVDAVAGHSVGAFAAAVACGALAFDDALRAVDVRGRAMARAFPRGYGMGAIGGLDGRAVESLVARVRADDAEIYAANVNAPDQIAVSGSDGAIEAVLALARARGARSTRRLDVVVPAHSPLMAGVETTMREALRELSFSPPRASFATNATARIVRDREAIRRDLSESIARPVRWADLTRALYERGTRLFVEARPGTTLTTLARYAFPDARAVAMDDTSLASIATLAREA